MKNLLLIYNRFLTNLLVESPYHSKNPNKFQPPQQKSNAENDEDFLYLKIDADMLTIFTLETGIWFQICVFVKRETQNLKPEHPFRIHSKSVTAPF